MVSSQKKRREQEKLLCVACSDSIKDQTDWKDRAESAERELTALRLTWEDAKKLHAKKMGELRAKLEAAQKDAERYRWLRTFESGAHPVWLRMCELDFCDEEMDAAIDAARAEKPE